MVRQRHVIVPATSARRLPDLHLAAAADRTVALSRTVRARPVARGDGDRLLRFPGLAGGDLRRRPRRIVRGAQRRQSGAGLSARRRRPWRLGGAGICGAGACASSTSWCSAMPNAAASAPLSTISSRCRPAISSADGWRCSSSRARVVEQRDRETMAGFHHPDREGRGVSQPGKPDDVSVRADAGRKRRTASARRLFRRRRGLAVRARSGGQGISQRAGIAERAANRFADPIRQRLRAAFTDPRRVTPPFSWR